VNLLESGAKECDSHVTESGPDSKGFVNVVVQWGGSAMTWTTPEYVEITASAEVTAYVYSK
jgi:coenzyme PQQ precursor peptide PqqA